MKGGVDIELAGEQLTLLPQRALYWPRTKTAFVADIHFGKTATFLAFSIPLPEGSTQSDLTRLSNVLAITHAERLVVLGDLLHAKVGRSPEVFSAVEAWRANHADLEILLVRGNHDRKAGDPPDSWCITVVDAPIIEPPFVFRHEPTVDENGYVLAGHLHPGVQLVGKGRQILRLPCYLFGKHIGILPAFSGFTGLHRIQPASGDQMWAIADEAIIPVNHNPISTYPA
jgi:DNA ligase-associated metallophosphoesterase